MKKLFLLIISVLCISTLTASAEGLVIKGGANFTNIKNIESKPFGYQFGLGFQSELPDGFAAQVHEGQGLQQQRLRALEPEARNGTLELGFVAPGGGGELRHPVDNPEADVVRCPLVFGPRIAEASHQLQGHGLGRPPYFFALASALASGAGSSSFLPLERTSGAAGSSPSAAGAGSSSSLTSETEAIGVSPWVRIV